MTLEQLLDKRQDIWRGKAAFPPSAQGVPTGFLLLDALLRDCLERLRPPAPVRAVALDASDIRPLLTGSLDLFPGLDRAGTPDPGLLDRLRARLGEEAVRGLALVADHRNETRLNQRIPNHACVARSRGL
jgi:hypothetical protein